MIERHVAIQLKVPDNAAFTALVALQRLGVPVERVERARIVRVSAENVETVMKDVISDENLYNPNLHRVEIRDSHEPRDGEVWVRTDHSIVAWRLFDECGRPVMREVLERARDALLCNPAFEAAELPA